MRVPRFSLRNFIGTVGFFTALWILWTTVFVAPKAGVRNRVLADRRRDISDAFQHAWDGYVRHCMGHDSLHPTTNSCDDDFGGWGVSAIDALSTAIIMEKQTVVEQILRYIAFDLDFEVVEGGDKIQLFEVAIRHFAGMISAWDLLNGLYMSLVPDTFLVSALHDQMVRLGDGLICGFGTASGVPRGWVNINSCETDQGRDNSIAGVGSYILEFERLSDITGNQTYGAAARRAEEYLLRPNPEGSESFPGLLSSFVRISDGGMEVGAGSWGALSDSFYEYLLKAYIYNQDMFGSYLERWKVAVDSTIRHLVSHPFGHSEWTLLSQWGYGTLYHKMDALTWFAGGNFILGGLVTRNATILDLGLSIADTAGALYSSTATGLYGEILEWTETCGLTWHEQPCSSNNSLVMLDPTYILRPEAIESWYYAYRATGSEKYRTWSWNVFKALQQFCRTDSGFGGLKNVTHPTGGPKIDKQESFLYAEVLKYLYLIHLDDELLPFQVQDSRSGKFNSWVLNTEAHPLRVAGRPV